MDQVTKTFRGVKRVHTIYTKEEADERGMVYKPWRDTPPGSWAISDDGFVAECLEVNFFKDKKGVHRALKHFSFGRVWLNKSAKLLFGPRKITRNFSGTSVKSWQELEARKGRTQRTVDAYVGYVVASQPINWEALGQIYRPEQQIPAATVKRLFKSEEVREMVKEGIAKTASKLGLDEEWVLQTYINAATLAANNGDAGSMIRAAKEVADLLDLSPQKEKGTDWLVSGMVDAETSKALDDAQKEIAEGRKVEAEFKEVEEDDGTNAK